MNTNILFKKPFPSRSAGIVMDSILHYFLRMPRTMEIRLAGFSNPIALPCKWAVLGAASNFVNQ